MKEEVNNLTNTCIEFPGAPLLSIITCLTTTWNMSSIFTDFITSKVNWSYLKKVKIYVLSWMKLGGISSSIFNDLSGG